MNRNLARGVIFVTSMALAMPPAPHVFAQALAPPAQEATATEFNVEQLDAMLAPIALYPDELLTQILMASTYPLQIVAAARWLQSGNNQSLKGDALVKALEKETWDPSVKSLVPFPQVISMLNDNLEWTQQLGYAVATQQADVLDSIQRLRQQAQATGSLKTTEQQTVAVRESAVVIEPTNPATVYVPSYRPAEVYGEWPYPSYPPVYIPPSPLYYPPGYVFGAGLAFATGVAVVASLWGWARPGWGYGNVTVNPLRYNNINVNRPPIQSGTWRPPANGAGLPSRPPSGPVGAPARPAPLPANAIGRPNVQLPSSVVNRPQIPAAPATRPTPAPAKRPAGPGPGAAQRPTTPGPGGTQRPAAPTPSPIQRPAGQTPTPTQRPTGQGPGIAQRPAGQAPGSGQGLGAAQRPAPAQRPAGAFNGINEGARAGQFEARGAQSRNIQQTNITRAAPTVNRGTGAGLRRR